MSKSDNRRGYLALSPEELAAQRKEDLRTFEAIADVVERGNKYPMVAVPNHRDPFKEDDYLPHTSPLYKSINGVDWLIKFTRQLIAESMPDAGRQHNDDDILDALERLSCIMEERRDELLRVKLYSECAAKFREGGPDGLCGYLESRGYRRIRFRIRENGKWAVSANDDNDIYDAVYNDDYPERPYDLVAAAGVLDQYSAPAW